MNLSLYAIAFFIIIIIIIINNNNNEPISIRLKSGENPKTYYLFHTMRVAYVLFI